MAPAVPRPALIVANLGPFCNPPSHTFYDDGALSFERPIFRNQFRKRRADDLLVRFRQFSTYNSAPFSEDVADFYHWHVEIIPTLTTVAGFEWATGFYLNPTSPEEAAQVLRDARA